jgi:neutral ceramidase
MGNYKKYKNQILPKVITTPFITGLLMAVIFPFIFSTEDISAANSAFGQNTFSVGVARVNITPGVPVRMSGYAGRTEPFQGVNDSLFAIATVFNDGINKAAILKADVIGFNHDSWNKITSEIEARTSIKKEFILLAPTHTHGGPDTRAYGEDDDKDLVAYNNDLWDKLVSVTVEAFNNLQPAYAGAGKGICKMSMNRRALNSSGGLRIGKNPYGPVDHEVGIVRFDNAEGIPFSFFVNWPTHATVMGDANLMITADWPGAARRYVEREYMHPVTITVTAGASGDIDPIYRVKPNFRAGEVEEIGIILGSEVIKVSEEIRAYPVNSINAVQRVITLPGKIPGGSRLPRESYDPGPDIDVRLSVLRIGNIVFAGISGEVFAGIGIQVKELSPYVNTFVITHCNGASGYLITDAAYSEGGYETASTRVMSGAERGIIENLIEMIHETD